MSIARLLGREDHGHEFPFELRIALDFRHVGELLGDPIYHLTSKLGVGDLPAAEHERHLHLVSFLQELSRVASLGHEVMLLDARTVLYFLFFYYVLPHLYPPSPLARLDPE